MSHDNRMAPNPRLSKYNIIAFLTIVDVARAKEFYRDKLGLRLLSVFSRLAARSATLGTQNQPTLRLLVSHRHGPAHGANMATATNPSLRLSRRRKLRLILRGYLRCRVG